MYVISMVIISLKKSSDYLPVSAGPTLFPSLPSSQQDSDLFISDLKQGISEKNALLVRKLSIAYTKRILHNLRSHH